MNKRKKRERKYKSGETLPNQFLIRKEKREYPFSIRVVFISL